MKNSVREKETKEFAIKLYDKMKKQNLVGKLTFQEEDASIRWMIPGYQIEIGQECIEVSRKKGGFFIPIIHWHPDDEEILNEICNIGTKGNVTVIHDGWLVKSVLYIESKNDCPYKRKWLFGRYHYIYAA